MPFEGDPLALYGRNILDDFHEKLRAQSDVELPKVVDIPDYFYRPTFRRDEKVGILGAGVGGLYTALMLDSLDIKYEILEASGRTGGRLYTHHFQGGETYDYYDVGAMRFPLPKKDEQGQYKNGVMKRLAELIIYDKLNQGSTPLKSKLIPYYYHVKEGSQPGYLYFNGQRNRTNDPNPDFQASAMKVEAEYIRVGVDGIVNDVIEPFARMIAADMETNTRKGWEVMKANDGYSTRAYMSFKYMPSVSLKLTPTHLSTNVINWCEMLDKSSGWYDRGLTETVLEALAFAKAGGEAFSDVDWQCFDGGSQTLTNYMEKYINGPDGDKGLIKFKRRVSAIKSKCDIVRIIITLERNGITGTLPPTLEELTEDVLTNAPDQSEYEDKVGFVGKDLPDLVLRKTGYEYEDIVAADAGVDVIANHTGVELSEIISDPRGRYRVRIIIIHEAGVGISVFGEKKERVYSHVVSTLPLAVLRTIDMKDTEMTVMQRTALRQLQYGPSIKIGIRFAEPWWTTKLGIIGGQSFTDLPVRTIVYPSYGVTSDQPSTVLIASYCWTNDAERMGSLINTDSKEVLKDLVLRNLAEVHGGEITYEFLNDQIRDMHAWDWNHNPLTMGAFAFFGPGDFQDLFTSLSAPAANNRLHFAGEAMSTRHAWVVGALDSAWRAVYEYLVISRQFDKISLFKQLWGANLEWTQSPSKAPAPAPAPPIGGGAEPTPRTHPIYRSEPSQSFPEGVPSTPPPAYEADPANHLLLGHLGFMDAAIQAGVLKY